MRRRKFNQWTLKGSIGMLAASIAGVFSAPSSAAIPSAAYKSNSMEEALFHLFGTREWGEDASINIQVPIEAEHHAFVPFRVSAKGAEKIAVMIDNNPQPLVIVMDEFIDSDPVMMGTLQMHSSSYFSCFVFKQNQVFRASRFIRLSASGYEN